jgi:hypothetical protein
MIISDRLPKPLKMDPQSRKHLLPGLQSLARRGSGLAEILLALVNLAVSVPHHQK